MNYIDEVAKFHKTFGHPVLEKPQIPDEKRCQLRVNLLQEELNELKEAIQAGDMVEVADALCDLQYVLSGAILEFGLKDQFNTLFTEVQRSNMSKACENEDQARETCEKRLKEQGEECYIKEKDGVYLVYRKSDNKTIKNIYYSPADLKSLLKS